MKFYAFNCLTLPKPETFDFLGFTHFCTRSRTWGSFVIGRKTIKKRMRAKLKPIKVELRHDPIATTGSWVKQVLQGHLNYYAVSANHPSLWWFCNQVRWHWLKSLINRNGVRDLAPRLSSLQCRQQGRCTGRSSASADFVSAREGFGASAE